MLKSQYVCAEINTKTRMKKVVQKVKQLGDSIEKATAKELKKYSKCVNRIMKLKFLVLVFLIGCYDNIYSQKESFFDAIAAQTGYACLGKNYGYVGFDKRIVDHEKWKYINVGMGSYVSSFENKIEYIPEIHLNETLLIFMGEVSVTTKAINPSFGINVTNRIQIKSGYNYAYKKENLKGMTFGINFNFGSDEYHSMGTMKMF